MWWRGECCAEDTGSGEVETCSEEECYGGGECCAGDKHSSWGDCAVRNVREVTVRLKALSLGQGLIFVQRLMAFFSLSLV